MEIEKLLPLAGSLNHRIHSLPLVGERWVRAQSRALARLAFHAPFLGGRRSDNLRDVRGEWLKFLDRAGIRIRITREDEREFEFELDACPYGFRREEEQGVCDACMDLDRTYVRLLGGELEVLESIPAGSPCCRSVVRIP